MDEHFWVDITNSEWQVAKRETVTWYSAVWRLPKYVIPNLAIFDQTCTPYEGPLDFSTSTRSKTQFVYLRWWIFATILPHKVDFHCRVTFPCVNKIGAIVWKVGRRRKSWNSLNFNSRLRATPHSLPLFHLHGKDLRVYARKNYATVEIQLYVS